MKARTYHVGFPCPYIYIYISVFLYDTVAQEYHILVLQEFLKPSEPRRPTSRDPKPRKAPIEGSEGIVSVLVAV